MQASLFALLASLSFFLYTLRSPPATWAALCVGWATVAFHPGDTRVLRGWVAWLTYGAAAEGVALHRFEQWFSVASIACMLATFVLKKHEHLIPYALAAGAAVPASSAVATRLPFFEFALKTALFAAVHHRERSFLRCAWILYAPVLSPVALLGAALQAGLTFREERAEEAGAAPPPDLEAHPPPPPLPRKSAAKQKAHK